MSDSLVIVGASARAAAASAVRAGFRPACADLFADVDLRRMGPALATADFPHGLLDLARQLPPGPWMYTGGLENYPDVVETLSRERVLYGNPPAALRAVRDPWQLAAALRRHGLDFPECRSTPDDLPIDGSWLCKRFHTSGGLGVRSWRGGEQPQPSDAYFQRRIAGAPCGAVYVAANRQARLIGITRQWLGFGPDENERFQYCGSFGPLRIKSNEPHEFAAPFRRIGEAIAAEFDLQGLFGVDAVRDPRGQIWPVEVNPRYTASVEILERALGIAAVGWHVAACRDGRLPDDVPVAQHWHAKGIVYAQCDLVIHQKMIAALDRMNEGHAWPRVADLPNPGTTIRQGQPVATAFVELERRLGIELRLHMRMQEILNLARATQDNG